ncbi:MAG: class I SAM-dependent methyltransferase [Pseudolabrys sp.]
MGTANDPNVAVWHRLSEQWDQVGSPFRPTPEDIGFALAALRSMPNAEQPGTLTSILLGVTPELAAVLSNTRNFEIDHSIRMLDWSWMKFPRGRLATPIAAKWTNLPIRDESVDLVFGDGCNIQLEFPGAYRTWFAEMARVLRPGGLAVLRVYVSPDTAERSTAVIDDLMHGRIGNSNVLRMRLFMALQRQASTGIQLSDLADYWSSVAIDKNFLTAELGWPAAGIDIFDMFRGMNLRYSFPTRSELKITFSDHFAELERRVPGYEIGSRCPTIVLQKIRR